ncbi:MAG: hypothetical protein ABIL09_29465 [Gemmatimonadota bacterium]
MGTDTKVGPRAATEDIVSIPEYVRESQRMLSYCCQKGIAVPDELTQRLSAAQGVIGGADGIAAKREVLSLHGQLSALVQPATPRSLAATDFSSLSSPDGRARPTAVLLACLTVAALVGIVGFVVTLPPAAAPGPIAAAAPAASAMAVGADDVAPGARTISAGPDSAVASPASPAPDHRRGSQYNYLWAALLGAAFNGLTTAYKYVRDRTFDAHYTSIYLVRCVIGLVAGVIAANLGTGLFAGDDTIALLGPGIIALLGGYAAEAVRQVLDRLVEILTTAVSGKDRAAQERLKLTGEVIELSRLVSQTAGTSDELRERVASLLRKLQPS